jgi:K+-sensing histidine kinase KdpD
MAASLQQAEESRRAMTADIAHELRNPLAVQRAHLEALQDGVYPATPENLAPVLDQNILLTRLVDDLRTLALADTGQLHLEFTPTDFPALVQRGGSLRPQADAQSRSWFHFPAFVNSCLSIRSGSSKFSGICFPMRCAIRPRAAGSS